MTLLEIIAINYLTVKYEPEQIFEIGTFDGRTTLNIASNTLDTAKIYTLDLPKDEIKSTGLLIEKGDKVYINKKESGERYKKYPESNKIIQLYGDSAKFDFAAYYGKMDLVLVDGSHSYPYAVNDTKIAFKLLKKDSNDKIKGLIIWHDYTGWEGVTKALNEFYLKSDDFKTIMHIENTSLAYIKF